MSEPLTFVPKPSLQFYDAANDRQMLYVYPDSQHWTAGWLLYQNPGDGQWVTLRKGNKLLDSLSGGAPNWSGQAGYINLWLCLALFCVFVIWIRDWEKTLVEYIPATTKADASFIPDLINVSKPTDDVASYALLGDRPPLMRLQIHWFAWKSNWMGLTGGEFDRDIITGLPVIGKLHGQIPFMPILFQLNHQYFRVNLRNDSRCSANITDVQCASNFGQLALPRIGSNIIFADLVQKIQIIERHISDNEAWPLGEDQRMRGYLNGVFGYFNRSTEEIELPTTKNNQQDRGDDKNIVGGVLPDIERRHRRDVYLRVLAITILWLVTMCFIPLGGWRISSNRRSLSGWSFLAVAFGALATGLGLFFW